jgi:LysR family transcriptional regulator, glycine cleavage system transcriptional activator
LWDAQENYRSRHVSDFPPLNATRAFVVAARCGGFAAAATELGVTSAAVSQHVRNLEAFLGKSLFQRSGNRIALTEAGHAYYPQLEALFGEFLRLTNDVRTRSGKARLVISVSPSLGELWLYDRLAGFDLGGVDLRSELDPVDFATQGIDLRVTYGIDQYPEHASAPIFADRILAVCSPDFLTPDRRFPEIADRWLIHTDWGPTWLDVPSWRAWFGMAGLPRDASPLAGLRTHLTGHAIAAAASGLGVALVPSVLARRDIARGSLIVAHPLEMMMDGLYGAIWPHARSRSTALAALLVHLGIRAAS